MVRYHGYEAPEFVAQGDLSAAADVFSRGAILGSLLLGRALDPRQPRSVLADLTTPGPAAPPVLLSVTPCVIETALPGEESMPKT